MRVLVAEDDEILADAIARGLRQHAMSVDVALDGAQALERAGSTRYDVVVLDRDLPEVLGDEVCRRLVHDGGQHARILMLTGASTLRDRVEGLNLGADDYLPKPFAFAELVARVHALLRRVAPARPPVIERAGIRLDPAQRVVTRDSRYVRLAPKEFAVLHVLLSAEGAVVSAEELLERAWDENADPFTNTMRTTIGTLRKKLGQPGVIDTVVGAGYRIP
ncbi:MULTISPECIES: response regulator transcription factor [unclassified Plantactinospora]|uniref:response regulator transcription factor n=1 Tax=unclassified Plantactinospora TaxID=2631981 RepID=UPI000D15A8C1|nr:MULTISPECIES: response regulator transcription factor [unclassified Plantactinospora]AVT31169.1 DNA-binding response regulator [Plantactinospora sp. BC1]AVT39715.1 DNA-binding response regulator [Plantactinospora sp. BB1]